jgi:hypothetical protein
MNRSVHSRVRGVDSMAWCVQEGSGIHACTLTSSAVESRLCSLSADTLDELNDRSNKLDSADTSG